MKRVFRQIALFMAVIFLLTACGKRRPEVPELLEPKASNESYRTVEYGDIGMTQIMYGVVVPTDICHFWKTSVNISEIKVDIGDYVNEGDVIAVADLDAANENISAINSEITLAQSSKAENDKKYELMKQELQYKLIGCQETGDSEGAATFTTELAVLEENHNYDNLLYQHNIDNLNERAAEQQEIVEDGTLTARASGYVTYVKDISANSQVNNTENVVVISDYNECYVELQDEGATVDKELLEEYPICYTNAGGKKCALVEYKYSAEELLVAQSRSKYPFIRLKYENEADVPEAGTNVPVLMQKEVAENVLIIGNDSLYQDEKGDFVYVKVGDKKEIRYVELGMADRYNSEVISGLSEGEQVYYSSESVLPESYVEYPVEMTDFIAYKYTDSYVFEDTQQLRYFSEYEGQVTDVKIKQGSEISEGDLICTIKTNEGSARLTEMSNAITEFKKAYEQSCKDYDAQLAELERQMAECFLNQNTPEEPESEEEPAEEPTETATDTDAEPETPDAEPPQDPYLYEELGCQVEQIKIDKKISEINYNYQIKLMEAEYSRASCNNDGTGTVMIYAETAGKLVNIGITPGKKVKMGDKLFNIEVPANKKVVLRVSNPLELNQPITFTEAETGKIYTGKVSGTTGSAMGLNCYLTTLDDKVYITESISGSGSERFYITMDDEGFFESSKKCMAEYSENTICNTVVLPRGMVYTEFDSHTKEDVSYVWRIVEGELVKQYVHAISTIVDGETVYCIINGLKPGDVLAQERTDTEEE